MDRLVVEAADGDQQRRCVACGHTDNLDTASSLAPRTRLGGGLKTSDSGIEAVRILEPPGSGSEKPQAEDDP